MSKAQWIKENLSPGEEYAGLILGKNGEQDYHLILLPGEAEKVTWPKASEWAGKAGGELPTRREQSLLFANLKEHFKAAWYWSCEQLASDAGFAWDQYFLNGGQGDHHESVEGRARAVRRLPIQ
ncbi:MAG: DUF1566 domain-containing protein [Rhodocyclaceae bacterium]|nr:DUF1566 domain-containing protein [Rhodocyclaceae bacterium]